MTETDGWKTELGEVHQILFVIVSWLRFHHGGSPFFPREHFSILLPEAWIEGLNERPLDRIGPRADGPWEGPHDNDV